jgi:hypothetical protein
MSANVHKRKKPKNKQNRKVGYFVSKQKNKLIKEQRSLRKQNKLRIVQCLAAELSSGMSTTELSTAVPCHRDTTHDICEELKLDGMVTKNGKFGKYFITSKAIGSPEIGGFLFGSKAMQQFYSFERPASTSNLKKWLSVNNKFCDNEYCKSIVLGKPYEEIIPDRRLKDQLGLFEFVIRIGAIITYEMVQALKYDSSPILKNQVNKDILAWKWVDNVIRPELILKAFAECEPVYRILKRNKNIDEQRGPFYEVDKKDDLKQLTRSLENVFPEVYEKLESIMKWIPDEVERIRNHARIRQLEKETDWR